MKPVFIYTLNCPITGEVRYVGKAKDPHKRLASHLASRGKYYRACWIDSLRVQNLKPILKIEDEVLDCYWQATEAAYIDFFREQGCNLVNGTNGGEGMSNPTLETRLKLRKPKSLEACEKMKINHVGMLGKKHSLETRLKMSAVRLGKKHSLEARENMRIAQRGANIGRKHSPETRENMRASHLGKKASLKACENMHLAQKLRQQKEKSNGI